ncbi:unnamed protein product [Pleuronectes platessa]|uniref:Uncharacterized protein n=1 Tax=Pleuronectes platessa TaxID=8262 RepID=A0A9N7V3M3_PLEPL|nr:unnamed protein product [Pleuronectes platessa]
MPTLHLREPSGDNDASVFVRAAVTSRYMCLCLRLSVSGFRNTGEWVAENLSVSSCLAHHQFPPPPPHHPQHRIKGHDITRSAPGARRARSTRMFDSFHVHAKL